MAAASPPNAQILAHNIHHHLLKSHLNKIPSIHRILKPQSNPSIVQEYLQQHPLPILAHSYHHSTLPSHDPKFTYANLAAQRLFQGSVIGTPTRSILAPHHANSEHKTRRELLRGLEDRGFCVKACRGEMMTKEGYVFRVEDCITWVMEGEENELLGQAVAFIRFENAPWFFTDPYHVLHLDS
ncbi:hypothetical protein BCR33DRAFT_788646 [Rhizoclosmatium globosum]|uniref:MEKHLA domain-containing protein n=1 Tax=Rhizoclosmatium globosum TaxID=329046 RepID=A0A1Y2BXG6_9FUNG|nr:hypothetical protein BCR33DRAFT_788646 [Rhizoclosmatium globosum]|eukprot:ORY38785.1 hypothetical protein BCR33DRAFT_788646 [Rhizoclosmatium globosum]